MSEGSEMSSENEIEKVGDALPQATHKKNLEGFAASVELPEGHQLVIGELPAGTVVEVATWQGTGRPDETTNRFLLSTSGSGLQRRERERAAAAEISNSQPTQQPRSTGSVGSNSYLGLQTYGVEGEVEQVMASNKLSNVIRGLFATISIIAITSLVLALLGFGAVVPKRGVDTAFGSSTSALVIYKKTPNVTIGEPTVAEVGTGADRILVFGPSSSFDNATLRIQTSAGQELVQVNAVRGRAFLAVPLIGWIAKPILG